MLLFGCSGHRARCYKHEISALLWRSQNDCVGKWCYYRDSANIVLFSYNTSRTLSDSRTYVMCYILNTNEAQKLKSSRVLQFILQIWCINNLLWVTRFPKYNMKEKKQQQGQRQIYPYQASRTASECVCVCACVHVCMYVCVCVCSVKTGFIKFCSEFLALKHESGCTVRSSWFCFFVNLGVSIGPLDHQIWRGLCLLSSLRRGTWTIRALLWKGVMKGSKQKKQLTNLYV